MNIKTFHIFISRYRFNITWRHKYILTDPRIIFWTKTKTILNVILKIFLVAHPSIFPLSRFSQSKLWFSALLYCLKAIVYILLPCSSLSLSLSPKFERKLLKHRRNILSRGNHFGNMCKLYSPLFPPTWPIRIIINFLRMCLCVCIVCINLSTPCVCHVVSA